MKGFAVLRNMNFLDFFYLKESPFGETPDPRFYFAARPHEETLRHLFWAVESYKGFTLVTGDAGSGKTTLSRLLYETFREEADFAFLLNPVLREGELLGAVCREFGIAEASLEALSRHLVDRATQGKRCILVVDEAQCLSDHSLEFIRLLTNLEAGNRKLLQVIFFAQPELTRRLEQPNLRQLQQRIVLQVRLSFLDEISTEAYIRHRIERAGGGSYVRFDSSAVKRIHRLSGGAPRLINKICELALRCAAFQNVRLVTRELVDSMPLENVGLREKRKGRFLSLLARGLSR